MLRPMLGLVLLIVLATPMPAQGAGISVTTRTRATITLYCDRGYSKCKPARIDPVSNPTIIVYTLYSDAVVKTKNGQSMLCASDWRYYQIAGVDDSYESCRIVASKNSITLYERFGPRKQDDSNVYVQFAAFNFQSLDCGIVGREFQDGKWLEIRYDDECERTPQ